MKYLLPIQTIGEHPIYRNQAYGETEYAKKAYKSKWHSGWDLSFAHALERYTWNAIAITDCSLIKSGNAPGWGQYIVVKELNGDRQFAYCHLESIMVEVPGTPIKKGDPIGILGNTGSSTARHLHFIVSLQGKNLTEGGGSPIKASSFKQNERMDDPMNIYRDNITIHPDNTISLSEEQIEGNNKETQKPFTETSNKNPVDSVIPPPQPINVDTYLPSTENPAKDAPRRGRITTIREIPNPKNHIDHTNAHMKYLPQKHTKKNTLPPFIIELLKQICKRPIPIGFIFGYIHLVFPGVVNNPHENGLLVSGITACWELIINKLEKWIGEDLDDDGSIG